MSKIPDSEITPPQVYFNRRQLLRLGSWLAAPQRPRLCIAFSKASRWRCMRRERWRASLRLATGVAGSS